MSYGKVKDTFWTDKKILALPDDAKLLALYFLTGPHRNILGCMRVPDGYIMADLGWTPTRLRDAIRKLCECRFICRDDDGWTLIRNQLKHDPLKVPNHVTAAITIANSIPRESKVFQELVPILKDNLDAIGKASEWHVDAIAIPEPIPEPLPDGGADAHRPVKKDRRRATQYPDGFSPDFAKATSAGLSRAEAEREAIKFRNHAVERGRTCIDWQAAWHNWCLKAAEFMGRKPPEAKATGPVIPNEFAVKLFHDTGRWNVAYGPEPGKPGCRAPKEILERYGLDASATRTEAVNG
jgi:hypothetical protein